MFLLELEEELFLLELEEELFLLELEEELFLLELEEELFLLELEELFLLESSLFELLLVFLSELVELSFVSAVLLFLLS